MVFLSYANCDARVSFARAQRICKVTNGRKMNLTDFFLNFTNRLIIIIIIKFFFRYVLRIFYNLLRDRCIKKKFDFFADGLLQEKEKFKALAADVDQNFADWVAC